MDSIKVLPKETEIQKKKIISQGVYDFTRGIIKKGDYVYLPVTDNARTVIPKAKFSAVSLPVRKGRRNLKESLTEKMTEQEISNLKTAYDQLGNIAIIEIDPELHKKEKLIANTLISINPGIKTVYKKAAPHSGKYRTQKLAFLAGVKNKIAVCKENNISLKLDVTNVYFSPRLSSDRKRIYEMVKPNEVVLVMFSGCGPYVCAISKNTLAKSVAGIEINPVAHKYAAENVKLNKLTNVTLYCGDAKKITSRLKEKFDRILMPLPKTGDDFLAQALAVAKKGTILHFYDFQKEGEFELAAAKIKKACKCKILRIVKCGQYSPHVFRICVDCQLAKK